MTEQQYEPLIAVYDIVEELIKAFDRAPTVHTVAPFISVLRNWRDGLNRILDAHDEKNYLPGDDVSV